MRELPQDYVPATLDEAVAAIVATFEEEDRQQLRDVVQSSGLSSEDWVAGQHFGMGMSIRNSFSLWHDTPLTRWFREQLELFHADDFSSVLMSAVYCDLLGIARNTDALVSQFHEYWKNCGYDNLGNPLRPVGFKNMTKRDLKGIRVKMVSTETYFTQNPDGSFGRMSIPIGANIEIVVNFADGSRVSTAEHPDSESLTALIFDDHIGWASRYVA